MDCDETRERMELAAAEPGGLERLMAGDTPDAALVAGHLTGCAHCLAELGRLRRSTAILREVIGSAPDPALRARTLGYVRAMGRERASAVTGETPTGEEPGPGRIVPTDTGLAAPPRTGPRGRRALAGWVAGAAAAAVLAAGLTAAVVVPSRDARISSQQDEISVLARVSAWTVRLDGRPDATRVALAGTGSDVAGSLVFSPSTGDLVVLATGLAAPADGRTYGCWLEEGGSYRWIGRMRFGGELAVWAGPVEGLDALGSDAVFRVSLDRSGVQEPEAPVLWGRPRG